MTNPTETARAAADRLETAPRLSPALVGFDGFIDCIFDAVDFRRDMSPEGYQRIQTISALAQRIGEAAGKSMNLEIVQRQERWGGNGPILAGALGQIGTPVTFIGAVSAPDDPDSVHPVYEEFAKRCAHAIPIALPGRTRALEFDDGKVMLNEPANVQQVTWERILQRTDGEEALAERLESAALIAIMNWSLLGGVNGIFKGLLSRILPQLATRSDRRIFIDISDPAKRTDEDLRGMLTLLQQMNRFVPLTLGLNLAEAQRIASVVGSSALDAPSDPQSLTVAAAALQQGLQLDCIVIHRRTGAAAAQAPSSAQNTRQAYFGAPFTARPRISTGAGDHFNAGFALGHLLDAPLSERLAVGCALAGLYVRHGQSPQRHALVDFLRNLPAPQPGG